MIHRVLHALVGAAVLVSPRLAAAQAVYEYAYPYNTADLIEDHFIVLDFGSAPARGWYYGTSDEFDSAREGYPPGFFVAEMSELTLSETSISFALTRPERFFTSPVPLDYRDVASIPPGVLAEWSMPLVVETRAYTGTRSGEEITLSDIRPPRVFRRRAE